MSFVYAEKQQKYYSDGKAYFSTNICSDTKITLCGAVHMNWCEKQAELIKLYGMVKSIIVFPNCCISFAGNDIFLANRLLTYLLDKQTFEIDDAIRYAFNLHLNANPNDIEFIICFADDENQTHITCIKEGKINNDCHSAWIGSPIAFNKLQELYLTELSKYTSSETGRKISRLRFFNDAIQNCGEDGVGGFPVFVSYRESERKFIYPDKFISIIERPFPVSSGKPVKLYDSAEDGGFAAHYIESDTDAIINIEQINRTILYTSRYRLCEGDLSNRKYNHLMLPIFCETESGKFL